MLTLFIFQPYHELDIINLNIHINIRRVIENRGKGRRFITIWFQINQTDHFARIGNITVHAVQKKVYKLISIL